MKILAISGRKQAGKDTCFRFLEKFVPGVRRFYFAEPLKRMCIDILGCPEHLVYGTDDDKNTRIEHLLWENFPVEVWESRNNDIWIGRPEFFTVAGSGIAINDDGVWKSKGEIEWPKRKQGPMSVREVLQYWGTEIFRKAYHNVWADACIRSIAKSGCEFAIITDCRFPNEVSATQVAGGKVLRLTRVIHPNDTHASEIALDEDRYDWKNFDMVLDNANLDVYFQSMKLHDVLANWGWIEPMEICDLFYLAEKFADEEESSE